MNATELIPDIESLMAMLGQPVSTEEAEDGWTQQSKEAALVYFTSLRQAITTGNSLPPLGIVRSLDHWGVVSGALLEEAARITNKLREITIHEDAL